MSALKPSQLEELVQKRRNEQDLDLESYIKAKNEILGYITNFKFKQLDEITEAKINETEKNIELGYLKCKLSLELEIGKYNLINDEFNEYDKKIKDKMVNFIIKSSEEFKQINKRIELTKMILNSRQNLNKVINNYFFNNKVIKLSRKELIALFEDCTDDLQTILVSGKLVSEDKNDHDSDVYEFNLSSKNSSFKFSINELRENIDTQIKQCEYLESRIEEMKTNWKKSTNTLIDYLQQIESKVVV